MAQALIENTKKFKATPPGRVEIHHNGTGFIRDVCETEEEVLDDIKSYMATLPAYDPKFFRVADPADPKYPAEDLYSLVPLNPKRIYPMEEVLARLFDKSEHMEFNGTLDGDLQARQGGWIPLRLHRQQAGRSGKRLS